MKNLYYTDERSIQMLIFILKANKIKKIVASPGATNVTFVGSIQQDDYFEIYSSVDERSAAYMACGLAAESGEPVVLSCTGATASRNYAPGLTEAYYRKLPVLAVTSSQRVNRVGHMIAQVIDRSTQMNDLVNLSVQVSATTNQDDEWANNIKINTAVQALKRNGGGPVHINLETTYSSNFDVKELPPCRVIRRYTIYDKMPELPAGRICVFIGNHKKFKTDEIHCLENFCKSHNVVVIGDHTSGYKGSFFVQAALLYKQENFLDNSRIFDLIIHIGEIYGDITPHAKQVWRVSEDGEIRDPYRTLTNVFEMPESVFFKHYTIEGKNETNELAQIKSKLKDVQSYVSELPFSNTWIASRTASLLPKASVLHLGILNSLRNWNLFETDDSILGDSNTGGFGIDGVLSTALGASLVNDKKLYFVIMGDLAFFYDMNALGNRHLGKNLRIMVINNGRGTEFTNYNHPGAVFGEQTSTFIAAGGHFGCQSKTLLKGYAEALGLTYLSAKDKEEYLANVDRFVDANIGDQSILFEVFTDSKDESDALKTIYNIKSNFAGKSANFIKSIVSDEQKQKIKNILKI